jgi:hypothetical protein
MSSEDNLCTVPIEGNETVVHDQLPSLEDIKTEKELSQRSLGGAASEGGSRRRFNRLLYIIVPLLVVILIIGLAVGLTTRNKSNSSNDNLQSGGSSAPVADRLTSTINFLREAGITDAQSFDNQASPQYKAAVWIANYDPLQLSLTLQSTVLQRYVLVVIYYAFNGEQWGGALGWLQGDSECSWSVTIDGIFEGAVCDSEGALTDLYIGKNEVIIFL